MLVQLEKNETNCFLCNTEELTKATKHILKSSGYSCTTSLRLTDLEFQGL